MDHIGAGWRVGVLPPGWRRTDLLGVKSIKVLKWVGRILAIFAAMIGVLLGFAGHWNQAIYAIVLALIVWYWTNRLLARMANSRDQHHAGQGRQPSRNA